MQINLSRRPFANRKLFWIAVWSVFFLSLSVGLWAYSEKTTADVEVKRLANDVADRERQVRQLKEEADKRTQQGPTVQLTERDAYELAAARRLISHKAFPWTRLVNEIEERVPKNVRILSIKVNESQEEGGAVVGLVEVKHSGRALTR